MLGFCKRWRGDCTCFLDKLFNKNWSYCCKQHDLDYEKLKENESTKISDLRFFACLKKKSWKIFAYLMYLGVRAFGRNFKGR